MAVRAWRVDVETVCMIHQGRAIFVDDEAVPARLRLGDSFCAPDAERVPRVPPEKVCVIHNGRMIAIALEAAPAHLRQGDTFCVPTQTDGGPPFPGDVPTFPPDGGGSFVPPDGGGSFVPPDGGGSFVPPDVR